MKNLTGKPMKNADYLIAPHVGAEVKADSWGYFKTLTEDVTDWEPCDFRIWMGGGRYHTAVRVEVTGRTVQYNFGGSVVRVKIIFVGDESPDVEVGGWMRIWWDQQERVW